MNDCNLEFELIGDQSPAMNFISHLTIHGSVDAPYTQVNIQVRTANGGPVFITESALVRFPPPTSGQINRGSWQVRVLVVDRFLGCGANLWVKVTAKATGQPDCEHSGLRAITCKNPPPAASACPAFGRSFAGSLWIGMCLILAGIVFSVIQVLAAGGVTVAFAFVMLGLWINLCGPTTCMVLRGFSWAFKRSVIFGVALSLVEVHPVGLLVSLSLGSVTGALVASMRYRTCTIPSSTTPLSNLQL